MTEILVQVSLDNWDFQRRDALKVRNELEDALEENVGEVVDCRLGANGHGSVVMDIWVDVEDVSDALIKIPSILQELEIEDISEVKIEKR